MMSETILSLFQDFLPPNVLKNENPAEYFNVDGITPLLIVTPENIEQISTVLQIAVRNNLSVVPRGGGTKLNIGNYPAKLDIVLCMSEMDKIIEMHPADMTVRVQAGTKMASIKRSLIKEGQLLPLTSPLESRATVGGTVSANVSGYHNLIYGTSRDLVIGTKFVQANGTVAKSGGNVVKNVTGYDLNKLFIGAIGTLGILAEISLKVIPLPRQLQTFLCFFPTLSQALEADTQIKQLGLSPTTSFILDANSVCYIDGYKDLFQGSTMLATELYSGSSGMQKRENEMVRICRAETNSSCQIVDSQSAQSLWGQLSNFGHINNDDSALLILRCGLRPSLLRQAYESILAELSEVNLPVSAILQQSLGLIRFYVWSSGPIPTPKSLSSLITRIRLVMGELEGYTVVEQCPAETKYHCDVWGNPGNSLNLMKQVKAQFDPRAILSPGRFIGRI